MIYRLLKTDSATRVLANPQLRTTEGETAQARFGDQIPVPVTVFTPIAQGGVAQQPVTSFEYKNVGVNIDITPRVHHDGDVSLALKLEVSSLGPALPEQPHLPQPQREQRHPPARRRDHDPGRPHPGRGAHHRSRASPAWATCPCSATSSRATARKCSETDIVMTMTPHVVRRPSLTRGGPALLLARRRGGAAAVRGAGLPPIVPAAHAAGRAAAASSPSGRRCPEPHAAARPAGDGLLDRLRRAGALIGDPRVAKLPRFAVIAAARLPVLAGGPGAGLPDPARGLPRRRDARVAVAALAGEERSGRRSSSSSAA